MKRRRSVLNLLVISLAIFFFASTKCQKIGIYKNQFIQLCCFPSKPKYISKVCRTGLWSVPSNAVHWPQ